jgi:hypothetical protein
MNKSNLKNKIKLVPCFDVDELRSSRIFSFEKNSQEKKNPVVESEQLKASNIQINRIKDLALTEVVYLTLFLIRNKNLFVFYFRKS